MEHSNVSEIEMTHINIDVKLEPLDQDDDYTQNVDPLEPDNNVHTKKEVLQDFKMEIEADASDQETKEDVLKYDQDNTEIKIEELDVKTEGLGNEALDTILDTYRIIQDDTSVHNQLAGNSSKHTVHGSIEIQKQTETNTTRYELSHSCEPQQYDVINEEPVNYANILNTTSPANTSRARSDMCNSGVDVSKIHKHSTSEEEGSKQSSSLIAHSQPHSSYVCDVCDMEFKNSRNLVSHKVVHSDQKLHVCGICKKEFSCPSALVTHNRIHTGEKPYACNICTKGFSQLSSLVRHKRAHTGQKPYVCDLCKKGFSDSSHLVRHKSTHTGQRPYLCDLCKKTFTDVSALFTHKRIHTGQKPYVCDICKKGFIRSAYLVTHKRIHTGQKPYTCDICKKGFINSSNLISHKRFHTGEKPFVCDICKKRFSHSSALVTHKLIHFGEKPYVCDICKKGFNNSSNLIRHTRTHHGQKSCA